MEDNLVLSRRRRSRGNIEADNVDDEVEKVLIVKKKEKEVLSKKVEKFDQDPLIRSFKTFAKAMDDWYIDPILGFVPGGVGDVSTAIISLYGVFVALVRVRSVPLALAMLLNSLLDMLIGLIPIVGVFGDLFFKSNVKNYKLIYGYVIGDEEIIEKVKKRAMITAIGIVIVSYLIYSLISLIMSLLNSTWDYVSSLMA